MPDTKDGGISGVHRSKVACLFLSLSLSLSYSFFLSFLFFFFSRENAATEATDEGGKKWERGMKYYGWIRKANHGIVSSLLILSMFRI